MNRQASSSVRIIGSLPFECPPSPKPHRFYRLLVDFEPEHVGPRIVPHPIEVELGSGGVGPVEVCRQDTLFVVLRLGQRLSQRSDETTSAEPRPGALGSGVPVWPKGENRG